MSYYDIDEILTDAQASAIPTAISRRPSIKLMDS